jgi:hypothetical protein
MRNRKAGPEMALPFLLSISVGNRQAQEVSQGEDSQGKIEMTQETGRAILYPDPGSWLSGNIGAL